MANTLAILSIFSILLFIACATSINDTNDWTTVFVDYKDYVFARDNIANISWAQVKQSFAHPDSISINGIEGFDWTKPYPGKPVVGFNVQLTVSRDVPIPEEYYLNASTTLSSLTFGSPKDLVQENNLPVKMHPDWYICRHIFIAKNNSVAREAVKAGQGCGFLSDQCKADIKTSLTKGWGTLTKGFMCGAFGHDPIPESCFGSFGPARADVIAFDGDNLADPEEARALAIGDQSRFDWRIGTSFDEGGHEKFYQRADNRTYLVATVWGYSASIEKSKIKSPEVSLACLSSWGTINSTTPIAPKVLSQETKTMLPTTGPSSNAAQKRYAVQRLNIF